MSTKRRIGILAASLLTMLAVVARWGLADAAPGTNVREPRMANDRVAERRAEITTILAVLEQRIADPTFRTKATEKLSTLSDRQLRLMASLSRRMATDGDAPAAGIALLLMTALLILS